MKLLFRLVGRLLFACLLITSAYIKITRPSEGESVFLHGYSAITNLHPILHQLPPISEINKHVPTQTIVKGLGIFEATVAFLIIFGDMYGGFLSALIIWVQGLVKYGTIAAQAISKQSAEPFQKVKPEVFTWLILLGISLVLMTRPHLRKAARNV